MRRLLFAISAVGLIAATPSGDRLEPGLQGQTMPEDLKTEILAQPYSRNVHLVGHTSIGNRWSNLQMAWADNCAYISSTIPDMNLAGFEANPRADKSQSGVAVLDVSNPRRPRQAALLRDRDALYATETMHAVSAPGRKVLVAGAYAGGKPGAFEENAAWLDTYDVSSCARPRQMSQYKWPENVHMVTISPNGKRVYGTIIETFSGGGIFVLDISDLARPRLPLSSRASISGKEPIMIVARTGLTASVQLLTGNEFGAAFT